MATLVSVGNGTQPFGRLIEAVLEIAPQLPQPVVIQHGHTPMQDIEVIAARPFLEMEVFARLVEEAELLILHAGAGSALHAIRAGKTPVLMPRRAKHGELVDDHQLEFARALAQAGEVVVVEDPGDLLRAVKEALTRQRTPRSSDTEPFLVSSIREVLRGYDESPER